MIDKPFFDNLIEDIERLANFSSLAKEVNFQVLPSDDICLIHYINYGSISISQSDVKNIFDLCQRLDQILQEMNHEKKFDLITEKNLSEIVILPEIVKKISEWKDKVCKNYIKITNNEKFDSGVCSDCDKRFIILSYGRCDLEFKHLR